MREKIDSLRVETGGAFASRENSRLKQKQIRILESRLEKALVKFNDSLAANKKLREEIDNLRSERVVFDGIYRKMERKLQEKKQEMAMLIEHSNEAYEIRDGATVQLMDLQAAMAKEREDFEREVAELEDRIKQEEEQASKRDRQQRGAMGIDQEKALKDQRRAAQEQLALEKARQRAAEDKVEYYEGAFNAIQEATGISDVEELVAVFTKNEEANFSLFNFAAEQSAESERLEDRIARMREDVEAASAESGTSALGQRHALRELEKNLTSARRSVADNSRKYEELAGQLEGLRRGVKRAVRRLECTGRGYAGTLDGAAVTETNSVQFLGLVERRADEVLQAFAAAKAIDAGLVPGNSHRAGSASSGSAPRVGTGTGSGGAAGGTAGGSEGSQGRAGDASTDAQRRQVARTIAAVLGPGPASRHKESSDAMPKVQPPRLRDMEDEQDSDEDSDEEARPLSMAELKKSVRGYARGNM